MTPMIFAEATQALEVGMTPRQELIETYCEAMLWHNVAGTRLKHTLRASLLCAAVGCLLSIPIQAAPTGAIQGVMLDADGKPFRGATLSIRNAPAFYGPTFGADSTRYVARALPPGNYEIGVHPPDGYTAAYSVCVNCTNHPPASWVNYGPYEAEPLRVTIPASGGFVDVWWKFNAGQSPSEPANQWLTCNVKGIAILPTTMSESWSGSEASVTLGANQDFGGVLTSFRIANNLNHSSVDVLDARSSAGAAMQTAFMMLDKNTNRIIVANQAAGNMAQQWGFRGVFLHLVQTDWSPIFSDHYHPHASWAEKVNTSPCYHGGYRLHDGQLSLTGETVPSSSGNVIRLTNQYTLRALMNQSWQWFAAEQAFYLSRQVARTNNLRIYLAGAKQWSEGPIKPVDTYSLTHAAGSCPDDRCTFHVDWLSYGLLVWNIGGQDIGVAIRRPDGKPFQAQLNLTKNVECQAAVQGDICGNIEWHSYITDSRFAPSDPVRFAAGETVPFVMTYTIGSLQQLSSLHLGIPD